MPLNTVFTKFLNIFGLLTLLTSLGYCDQSPKVIYLYPAGSPTLQGTNEKEITTPANPKPGELFNIKNVHNPMIEVHLPPADKSVGTAIVVAPGGGHSQVVWGTEGVMIADWLNSIGIAAILLKYRLAFTPGYKYTVEGEALMDTQRAIRLARANAKEWGYSPDRVGIMGFSAGGALAALAVMRNDAGKPDATDSIEHMSDRPDFNPCKTKDRTHEMYLYAGSPVYRFCVGFLHTCFFTTRLYF